MQVVAAFHGRLSVQRKGQQRSYWRRDPEIDGRPGRESGLFSRKTKYKGHSSKERPPGDRDEVSTGFPGQFVWTRTRPATVNARGALGVDATTF